MADFGRVSGLGTEVFGTSTATDGRIAGLGTEVFYVGPLTTAVISTVSQHVWTIANFKIQPCEYVQRDLGLASMVHDFRYNGEYGQGTDANELDQVWSDEGTATAGPVTIDVLNSLASVLTAEDVSFVSLCGVWIEHTGTTGDLLVGGGSTPVPIFANSSDKLIIKPGGLFLLLAPASSFAPAEGSSDVLQLDPSASTIPYRVALFGRSTA